VATRRNGMVMLPVGEVSAKSERAAGDQHGFNQRYCSPSKTESARQSRGSQRRSVQLPLGSGIDGHVLGGSPKTEAFECVQADHDLTQNKGSQSAAGHS